MFLLSYNVYFIFQQKDRWIDEDRGMSEKVHITNNYRSKHAC